MLHAALWFYALCLELQSRVKMKTNSSELSKLDRKTVEKNRRIQMKGLCFKLASLIPPHYRPSKGMLTQLDQLDYAASYIKQMKERMENLKVRKEQAMGLVSSSNEIDTTMAGSRLPIIDLRDMGSGIEVSLISGLQKNFMLSEVISILHEEGAEVVSASFSAVGDKVFHTIHAQVKISRVGVETSRVWQRLQELVY